MPVETLALTVRTAAAARRDCCEELCWYSPRVIAYVMRICGFLERHGEDVSECLSSVMTPHQGYERDDDGGVFGPTMEARWALYVTDVRRAMAAGCTTAEEASAWLCPFSGLIDEGASR